MLLVALILLGSPSFIIFAAAANQCFGADDGGKFGILYFAVRDYMSQDCPANSNCTIAQTYGWPMNSWCVGKVTDMSWLFSKNSFNTMDTFNEDISGWDTSNVTNMHAMFFDAASFNGDLSAWDVSSVTDNMDFMFAGARSFNSDISAWDLSSIIEDRKWMTNNMRDMFMFATSFNQDLCAWGHYFPYNYASDIFQDSGCTYQVDPQEDQKGPFCASDCNDDTLSITPESSGAVY